LSGGTLRQGDATVPWDPHGYYEIALDRGSVTLSPWERLPEHRGRRRRWRWALPSPRHASGRSSPRQPAARSTLPAPPLTANDVLLPLDMPTWNMQRKWGSTLAWGLRTLARLCRSW